MIWLKYKRIISIVLAIVFLVVLFLTQKTSIFKNTDDFVKNKQEGLTYNATTKDPVTKDTISISPATETQPLNIPSSSNIATPSVPPIISTTISPTPPKDTKTEEQIPLITYLSGTVFRSGDSIEIKGKNFTVPMSVFIAGIEFKNPTILNKDTIQITVPRTEEGPALVWMVTPVYDTRVYQALFIIIKNSSENISEEVINIISKQNEQMFSLPL